MRRELSSCAALSTIVLIASLLPAIAAAQSRPSPALDLSAGWMGFPDDGIVSEVPLGVAARWYLTPRVSVGPEFTHVIADSHSHQILTANLTFDFVSPQRARQVIPFVVIGGGWFRTTESFGLDSFDSTEGAFTVGGGVRYIASDRVSIGIDARAGWESHVRVNGLLSIRLGR